MEDAWNFGPGNTDDPGAWNYNAYEVDSGIDFGGGWSKTFQDIARVVASAYTQNMLMQTDQEGKRYIEGQRIAALRNGLGLGFRPNTLLLIGGAVLVYVLMKK